jgi:hypothetical protein
MVRGGLEPPAFGSRCAVPGSVSAVASNLRGHDGRSRPQLFAEFHRVLAPGGMPMLTFQIGDERSQYTELFGTPISLDVYRQQPNEVATLLAKQASTFR